MAVQEISGDGHRQGCAFFGVGGRTQLIEQHQGRLIRQLRDAFQIGDVGGEGREVLLDRLRVADVGQKSMKERNDRLRGRHRDSRLGHHAQQTGGLERDRLAAGIGAADDELPLLVVQRQGERHHRCLPRAQALFEQGMAGLLEVEHRRRRVGKAGAYAVKLGGKSSSCLQPIDLGQGGRALGDGVGLEADLPRHGQEDAPGLGLFFFDQPHQLVVLFDGLERLQVDRLAARGLAPCTTPGMRRLCSALTGMTKRSPRMVIRSSCVLPPSERRRRVLRRLSSITLCWRSISLRIRRRSGDASSLSEPSGFRRERSERASWASCAPAGNWLSAVKPSSCPASASGGSLDQRLPGGDVIHQKQQVANLLRLQQCSLDARLIGQPGGIEQPAQRG